MLHVWKATSANHSALFSLASCAASIHVLIVWSAVGHIHRQLIWQSLICSDLQDMGLYLSRSDLAEIVYDNGD